MENEFKEGVIGLFVVCVIIAVGTSLLIIGTSNGKAQMKREAVKRGHAEWVVDKVGTVGWRWKDFKAEEVEEHAQ